MLQPSERAAGPFGNLSLKAKGVLVIAIPVIALLVAMGVFYQFQRQVGYAQTAVIHSFEVGAQIRRVLNLMANAETGVRGYLLTRQDDFLEPYTMARSAMPGQLAVLEKLVADSPTDSERMPGVRKLANDELAAMEELRQTTLDRDRATTLADLNKGKTGMDELRRALTAMGVNERNRLDVAVVNSRRAMRRAEIAIFAGGLLGLVGGLIAAVLFTVRIARRVQRVEKQARLVAQGVTLEGTVTGADEIARLERALQETSRLLAGQDEELRAVHAELQTRVATRTAALRDAGEELRKANEVRQAVLQSAPLGICALDLEGRITFWNPGAERMYGWSESEVLGQTLPAVPAEQQQDYAQWLARFRRGESLTAVERTRLKKNGSRFDVSIWTTPIRDAFGAVSGTIAIASDVTERKLLEEQFRQSQKLEAVGRLAGGVAHDFNNLLTVIMGYVEMLIVETRETPKLSEYAQEIQNAADRASALTAQMLAFSRRQMSQPRVIDLNEVVTHSMKLLRRVIGEDVEISVHLDPKLGRVKVDPIHIDQMMMNLVVNARDAMLRGGMLTIETANVMLDDEYRGRHIGVKAGPYTMLAISDTGIGMTPEVRNRLFEPFFTTKEGGKGTGLGLAIVYGIVKQNDGEIMVYSEPDKGTTFKIYLPLVDAPADLAASEQEAGDGRGTETVLVCEDETGIRKLVVNMLTRQGYRVLEAETPAMALQFASDQEEAIDLVLTDVVMPKLNGFELAEAIRELRPRVKVLYMSGYTDAHINGHWALSSGTPFLQKPFTAGALSQKLREVLGTSAAGA